MGYAAYEARGFIFGPAITIAQTTTETTEPFILVRGHTKRITTLAMNGKTISVTEAGDFEEPYLLAPGYNRIILDATDQYDRSTQEELEVIYTAPPEMTPEVVATSSEVLDTQAIEPESPSSTPAVAQ